jgi:hypothetical protein
MAECETNRKRNPMGRHTVREKIALGRWSSTEIDRTLAATTGIASVPRRIAHLSQQFLAVPYRESTLVGGVNTPELLTIDFEGVDCFTYIDYVEAMRRSESFAVLKKTLRMVRYRDGRVAYSSRNHFFTDWIGANPYVEDATGKVGRESVRTATKQLNDRGDGTRYVPGIAIQERRITYIPGRAIDQDSIERIRTGDYIGIYSRAKGLDVSHVGIVIKFPNHTRLRHASSSASKRRVIEEDLVEYLAGKPGIVILRPRATPRPLTP